MGWTSGIVVFFLTWWTVLFMVLPIGIQPDPKAEATGGWRGAPRQVRLWRVVGLTTVLAVIVWLAVDYFVSADWLSFRSGWLAMPND